MAGTKRILCPVDFSASSRHALAEAAGIARRQHASLTVLHVFAAGCTDAAPPNHANVTDEDACGGARAQVESAIRTMTDAVAVDLPIQIEAACDSDPADAILRRIDRLDIDLVVMGTHGRSGLEDLLRRSTIQRVLRDAPCPVLSVPLSSRRYENPAADL